MASMIPHGFRRWPGALRRPAGLAGMGTLPTVAALVLTALVLAALAGCAGPGNASRDGTSRPDLRFIVVTHGQSADPFWSVVANGVRDAGRELGVRVEYQAPTSFEMVEMANLIDAAVASRPAGLVVSIPDPAALAGPIRRARDAGIPIVSINSGAEASRDLGLLAHVGQTEYEAGLAGGERLAAAGVRRALCVNHEVGNVAQDQRCQGLRDALASMGGTVRVLAVQLADPEDTQQRIAGALAADAAVDGVMTLGPAAAGPALAALRASGRADDVVYATFDLTTEVLAGIADGRIAFAIDQQQYLQGYLPIVLLTKYLETRAVPGGGEVVRTGPGFVTAADAAAVMELTRRGLR
jgi:simple sugar transport system substrate-binding protein